MSQKLQPTSRLSWLSASQSTLTTSKTWRSTVTPSVASLEQVTNSSPMVSSYTRPRDPTASAIRTPTLSGVSHRCGPMAPHRSNLTSHWTGRTTLATSTSSFQVIWSCTESYRWLAHSISPSKMLDSLAKGSSLWIPSWSSSLSGASSQLNSSRRPKLVPTATNCKISSKVMVIVKSWSVTRTKQLILNVSTRRSQKAQTWTHTGCLMS